jgi:hypothetical protein
MDAPVPRDVAGIIARLVCATAIEYKQLDKNALVRDGMRLSKNWNTLRITHENIFDHQLWVNFSRNPQLRFDKDNVVDCKKFWTNRNDVLIVSEASPCFDGPNYDGGQHHGVVAVAHSTQGAFLPGDTTTQFNLFALNGIPVSRYQGPEKKRRIGRDHTFAIVHKNFAYTSPAFAGEECGTIALSAKNMLALATIQLRNGPGARSFNQQQPLLRVFRYDRITRENNGRQETAFQVNTVACGNVPALKKLCWIYSKLLVGITNLNNLCFITFNNGKIVVHPQWIPLKIKDIAVHQPSSPHELIMRDEDDSLYYANLANRNDKGALKYYRFYQRANTFYTDHDIGGNYDTLWYFQNTVGGVGLKTGHAYTFGFGPWQQCQTADGVLAWLKRYREQKKKIKELCA